MDLVAILLAAGLAVGLLAFSTLDLVLSDESRVTRRLRKLGEYEAGQARQAEPLLTPFLDRVMRPSAQRIAGAVRSTTPTDYKQRLERRIILAGTPRGMDVDRVLALKVLAAVAAAMLAGGLAMMRHTGVPRALALAIVLGMVGTYLPDIWLRLRVSERQGAIRRALPDMLDMLTISVEAGLGFDAAVAKLVANSKGPLAEEFGRMLQEVQAGLSRRDALRHLGDRTDVGELETFVTSMIQADVFGVSISKVLRTQAREMRVKRRQRAEEFAQKAPVKMVFPLVLCILPATILVIIGPAVVQIGRAFGLIP